MSDSDLISTYSHFVDKVTSPASKDFLTLLDRLRDLEQTHDVNIPRLMTAAIGIGSEAGEFSDQVKKVLFQNKSLTKELIRDLESELGDVLWYVTQACLALNIDLSQLIGSNVQKLSKRYAERLQTSSASGQV